MSNNYTLSTVYGSLAAGNQPLSDSDATNGQLAAMGTLMCLATGTNTVTLTSLGGYPTMTAYGNIQKVGFVATNTTTSLTSIQYSALSSLNAYLNDGVTQIGSSVAANLTAGHYYEFAYNSALNSSAGGWQLSAGSSSSNTLTPYTPSLSFGGASVGMTYTTQSGAYLTVGNLVVAEFNILLSSNGSSTGSAAISIPIATNPTYGNPASLIVCQSNGASLTSSIFAQGGMNASTFNLYFQGSSGLTPLTDANFTSTTNISGMLQYLR